MEKDFHYEKNIFQRVIHREPYLHPKQTHILQTDTEIFHITQKRGIVQTGL